MCLRYRTGSSSLAVTSGQIQKNAKRKYTGLGRKRSLRPELESVYDVTDIDPSTGVPNEPEGVRYMFSKVCGVIVKDRVSITVEGWKKLTDDEIDRLANEIMNYFRLHLPQKKIDHVRRAALALACKSWNGWKNKLVTEYINKPEGDTKKTKGPRDLYPMISQKDWDRFVLMKTSPEFQTRSDLARKRAKKFTSPHNMGTRGYSGMAKIWEMEDAQALKEGRTPPFAHIKNTRARNWVRARATFDETTGKPKFPNAETTLVYLDVVSDHMLIFSSTS